jgi:hypothetical protein
MRSQTGFPSPPRGGKIGGRIATRVAAQLAGSDLEIRERGRSGNEPFRAGACKKTIQRYERLRS